MLMKWNGAPKSILDISGHLKMYVFLCIRSGAFCLFSYQCHFSIIYIMVFNNNLN